MSETKVIFEKSVSGRIGVGLPETEVPESKFSDHIPSELLRTNPTNLPEVSEPQVVRHYVNLSVKNHHIDKDFYPAVLSLIFKNRFSVFIHIWNKWR